MENTINYNEGHIIVVDKPYEWTSTDVVRKIKYNLRHKGFKNIKVGHAGIAVSGLKMVQNVDLNQNKNLFVVSTILISGIGGLTLTFGKITITAVACALILGIIVNLILSKKKED